MRFQPLAGTSRHVMKEIAWGYKHPFLGGIVDIRGAVIVKTPWGFIWHKLWT